MNAECTTALLVRLYPAAWRARYGAELESLITEMSGERVAWRTRIDVVRAALRERARGAGRAPARPPAERMRGGAVAVLSAWALFVVAGVGVQKFSEHWQSSLTEPERALPAAAFAVLVAAAVAGTALVLAGVAAALPAAVRLLRTEAASVRRQLAAAAVSTAVAVPLTVALVVVAHGLTERQRNGHDAAYLALGLVWAAFALGCFVAWTALGVAIAKRIELPASVLRFETILAAGTTLAMVAMTAATAVWWAALALRAPSFFAASPRHGASGSPLAPQLLAAQACMLVATVVAAAGSSRALRALRAAR